MKQKLIYIVIFAVLIVLAGVLIIFLYNNKKNYEEILEQVNNFKSLDGNNMLYVIDLKKCDDCITQKFQYDEMIENNNLEFYYIDVSKLNSKYVKKIYNILGIDTSSTLPIEVIYKDGKLQSSLSGLTGTNRLFNLLKSYDLVTGSLPINYLPISNFATTIENSKVILALGNYLDVESNKVEKLLWNISKNNSININYLYTINLTESEIYLFESKLLNKEEYIITVPGIYIIDNGVIKGSLINSISEDEYLDFFKEYGIID